LLGCKIFSPCFGDFVCQKMTLSFFNRWLAQFRVPLYVEIVSATVLSVLLQCRLGSSFEIAAGQV
jgi:hypothetical protein